MKCLVAHAGIDSLCEDLNYLVPVLLSLNSDP
jgi:hypothetical protein